ncbi:HDIG domain-containing metalloprotein [Mesotoga sp.]|uniref:HDIG domain-containing metalloprotein n=1 Tax=Mesotoga sp. TaxID=2053577 RepID=UPI00345E0FB9
MSMNEKKKTKNSEISKVQFPLERLLNVKDLTNFVAFPIFLALLNRLPFLSLPSKPFLYFVGSAILWYIFAERSVKSNRYFNLHRAYRITFFSVVSFGVFVNSFVPSLADEALLPEMTPIFLSVSIVTVLIGYQEGIGSGLFMSFLASANLDNSLETFILLSVVVLATALTTRAIERRIEIARAGFEVSLIFTVVNGVRMSLQGEAIRAVDLLIAFANPILSSVIVIGIIPYLEYASRIYSDTGLLELGNLSHPLLKNLSIYAPGTYYHSISVANLSEAAAERIGANAILARVAAYFHDIGKSKRPQYFTENQQEGTNPHDNITPSMSNLVINEHVKQGIEQARKYRLPLLVEDVIKEHHGTRIKKFFFHKAKTMGQEERSDDFRYPGPKPQFKESGIIMLADSVEAAFKSIKKPTPAKTQELVEEVVNGIYNERQLDQSGLDLDDLEKIIEAFTRVLMSMNQPRIEYPKEATEKVVSFNGDSDTKQDTEEGRREHSS